MVMPFANRMIYPLIQLRPVTYRGVCDLTLLDQTDYRPKLLFLCQIPAPAREPTTRLLGSGDLPSSYSLVRDSKTASCTLVRRYRSAYVTPSRGSLRIDG